MNLLFFVDPKNTEKNDYVMSKLDELGHSFMVDSVHHNLLYWMETNFTDCPHIFFSHHNGNVEVFNSKEIYESVNGIDLVVYFNQKNDIELNETDFTFLVKYFTNIFKKQNNVVNYTRRASKLLETSKTLKHNVEEKMEIENEINGYELKVHIAKERDVGFFEITKPNCDLPYTVVINEYSKVLLELPAACIVCKLCQLKPSAECSTMTYSLLTSESVNQLNKILLSTKSNIIGFTSSFLIILPINCI